MTIKRDCQKCMPNYSQKMFWPLFLLKLSDTHRLYESQFLTIIRVRWLRRPSKHKNSFPEKSPQNLSGPKSCLRMPIRSPIGDLNYWATGIKQCSKDQPDVETEDISNSKMELSRRREHCSLNRRIQILFRAWLDGCWTHLQLCFRV